MSTAIITSYRVSKWQKHCEYIAHVSFVMLDKFTLNTLLMQFVQSTNIKKNPFAIHQFLDAVVAFVFLFCFCFFCFFRLRTF